MKLPLMKEIFWFLAWCFQVVSWPMLIYSLNLLLRTTVLQAKKNMWKTRYKRCYLFSRTLLRSYKIGSINSNPTPWPSWQHGRSWL